MFHFISAATCGLWLHNICGCIEIYKFLQLLETKMFGIQKNEVQKKIPLSKRQWQNIIYINSIILSRVWSKFTWLLMICEKCKFVSGRGIFRHLFISAHGFLLLLLYEFPLLIIPLLAHDSAFYLYFFFTTLPFGIKIHSITNPEKMVLPSRVSLWICVELHSNYVLE